MQGRKRKCTLANAKGPPKPLKRRRKSANPPKTSVPTLSRNSKDKRIKFLERNRIAASKCRQKKKEWTSNLEIRARELQHEKNQMTVLGSSLKDEVMFLKGEILKHVSCGCDQIQGYLTREADNIARKAPNAPPPPPPPLPFPSAANLLSSKLEEYMNDVSETSSHPITKDPAVLDMARTSSSPVGRVRSDVDIELVLARALAHDCSTSNDEGPRQSKK